MIWKLQSHVRLVASPALNGTVSACLKELLEWTVWALVMVEEDVQYACSSRPPLLVPVVEWISTVPESKDEVCQEPGSQPTRY
mmetsp:Transcript_96300/g.171077  ORF Transcript_96300/g.171077 Transcript_96300/m.171077 type:complete len:83 (-) Transcript_96300:729-977(-)